MVSLAYLTLLGFFILPVAIIICLIVALVSWIRQDDTSNKIRTSITSSIIFFILWVGCYISWNNIELPN